MANYIEIFPNIYQIKTPGSFCFLIRGQENDVLVDTGNFNTETILLQSLEALGAMDRLSLIFITHAHSDHCANIRAICERTDAKVAIFPEDAQSLTQGVNAESAPRGLLPGIIKKLLWNNSKQWGYEPDIMLSDFQDLSLFGIHAMAIALPGHTQGSGGLLIDNLLFCGDHVMNFVGNRMICPIYINDYDQWILSTQKVLQCSEKIMIAHGGPVFDSADLEKFLNET